MKDADEIIRRLDLKPHPEGGYYREVYRHADASADTGAGRRGDVTTIYFLLREGQVSRWHRVDAVEIWHYYAGASLTLDIAPPGAAAASYRLGIDLAAGARPVRVVQKDAWQSARTNGAWTLVGCTVAPAFEFSGFELAPEGWTPGPADPD